jgi:hypothetical protein
MPSLSLNAAAQRQRGFWAAAEWRHFGAAEVMSLSASRHGGDPRPRVTPDDVALRRLVEAGVEEPPGQPAHPFVHAWLPARG